MKKGWSGTILFSFGALHSPARPQKKIQRIRENEFHSGPANPCFLDNFIRRIRKNLTNCCNFRNKTYMKHIENCL